MSFFENLEIQFSPVFATVTRSQIVLVTLESEFFPWWYFKLTLNNTTKTSKFLGST